MIDKGYEEAITLLREMLERDVPDPRCPEIHEADKCFIAWWAHDRARQLVDEYDEATSDLPIYDVMMAHPWPVDKIEQDSKWILVKVNNRGNPLAGSEVLEASDDKDSLLKRANHECWHLYANKEISTADLKPYLVARGFYCPVSLKSNELRTCEWEQQEMYDRVLNYLVPSRFWRSLADVYHSLTRRKVDKDPTSRVKGWAHDNLIRLYVMLYCMDMEDEFEAMAGKSYTWRSRGYPRDVEELVSDLETYRYVKEQFDRQSKKYTDFMDGRSPDDLSVPGRLDPGSELHHGPEHNGSERRTQSTDAGATSNTLEIIK